MKIPNLKDLMISITDVKQQLSEVISKKSTKVIIKNNEPVSVIMPYNDYLEMTEKVADEQRLLREIGQDVTLPNGVQVKVVVEQGKTPLNNDGIMVKTYVKMKTTGDYKLHHTLQLGAPNVEETMTTEEIIKHYGFNRTE